MRIVLVCSGGMTTSVLARGMQELVIDRRLGHSVEAFGLFRIREVVAFADLILLAPQVGYAYDSLVLDYPGVRFGVIDRLDYGRMRSGVVLDWALGLLG